VDADFEQSVRGTYLQERADEAAKLKEDATWLLDQLRSRRVVGTRTWEPVRSSIFVTRR
jgi:hypothetical protein